MGRGIGGYSSWGHRELETRLKRLNTHRHQDRNEGFPVVLLVPRDTDSYQPCGSGHHPLKLGRKAGGTGQAEGVLVSGWSSGWHTH